MTTNQPAVTVSEVSMEEWAMLAFHAARAPQRVRVTVRSVPEVAVEERAIGGARTGFWVLLAAATAGLAWLLV